MNILENSVESFRKQVLRPSRLLRIAIFVFLFNITTSQAVTVHINSGNPVYPFPQFQAYNNGTTTLNNLASHNSVGVPHAEMEQTIRDAYQIMMNAAIETGTTLNGVKYLYYKSTPNCSEGDGYGLLGAASMVDKTTFDGLWLWIHDNAMNKTRSYSTGDSVTGYTYSSLFGWTNSKGPNSATDGDVDIALALFIAYKQWGEYMGIKDSKENPISYKNDLIQVLKGLTDTLRYSGSYPETTYVCGDVGLDGYIKGGDSYQELTNWASTKANMGFVPESRGPTAQYFDYYSPSYFHLFADFLSQEDSAKYAWNISQFRRAEASTDWLMGQLYNANTKNLPVCGNVAVSDTTASFSFTGSMGEDFRLGWRTILNYVWNGNPTKSWNPSTHKVDRLIENSNELNMGTRYAKYLWDSRQSPWNRSCINSKTTDPFSYWGSFMLVSDIDMIGNGGYFEFLNFIPGVGSFSAVAAQDFKLMSQLYRYCEIEWDVDSNGDRYLTSVPHYYHGWFRLLGLMTLTGNFQSPMSYTAGANMKVYMDINKTYGFNGDSVTYTIDYRNYGSIDAGNVTIVDTIHKDFIYLSSTGSGVYDSTAHTVTWNIGTVKGFKTSTGIDPTKGKVKLYLKMGNPTQSQYKNHATITCSNGSGWTSNEYPNDTTAVMKRNYLDIAKRALVIDKSVSIPNPKSGDEVKFTIKFKNTSDAGWINGGRHGVHFSFSQSPNGTGSSSSMLWMRFRLFHNADEAYIDYNNYRVSYYLYDTVNTCVQGSSGCNTGWNKYLAIHEGIDSIKLLQEAVNPGQDSLGKWNQRIIIQFSDPTDSSIPHHLATIDHHLSQYRRLEGRIHRGGLDPLRLVWYLNSSSWTNINWTNAWSWDASASDKDDGYYYPVTDDWTDPDSGNIPVNTWNPQACSTSIHTVKNILVEEWDGYTWRRVAGNGPMPGRDANNVTIVDTIPAGLTFKSFVVDTALGVKATVSGNIITWTKTKMQVKDSGTIVYTATAGSSCPLKSRKVVNRSWISASSETPVADSAIVTLSCDSNTIEATKSTMILQNKNLKTISDTATIDTTVFYITVTDKDQNLNTKTRDTISAVVSDPSSGDSIVVKLVETGDSTGIFRSASTIAIVSGSTGANQLYANGGDGILVTYKDIYDSTDVSQVALFTLATFPVPVHGWILDANGDGAADSAVVQYDKTLASSPDSLRFFFPGSADSQTVKSESGKIYANGNIVNAVFPSPFAAATTAFSTGTSGKGLSFLVENGALRRNQFIVFDSVGPVLTAAQVVERTAASSIDTLYLTFSEAVQASTLKGTSFILISNGDSTVITIDTSRTILSSRFAVALASGTKQPVAGDSLRINPIGPVRDDAYNAAHIKNPAVPITLKQAPPYIISSYYVDRDTGGADGIVDTSFVQFNRTADINKLSFDLDWGNNLTVSGINSGYLSYSGKDSTRVRIDMRKAFPYTSLLKTSDNIYASALFSTFPGEYRTGTITDSAAPVIDSARYLYNTGDASSPDTLIVTFTEASVIASSQAPFIFSAKTTGTKYTMTLSFVNTIKNTAKFTAIPSSYAPLTGDSIWINSNNTVGDAVGIFQNNAKNRKVLLKVTRPASAWRVIVVCNPFTTDPASNCTESNSNTQAQGTIIKIFTKQSVVPPSITTAKLGIFDVLGNCIRNMQFPELKRLDAYSYYFTWDGRNRSGRYAGSGIYKAIVNITDEDGKTSVLPAKIGVK